MTLLVFWPCSVHGIVDQKWFDEESGHYEADNNDHIVLTTLRTGEAKKSSCEAANNRYNVPGQIMVLCMCAYVRILYVQHYRYMQGLMIRMWIQNVLIYSICPPILTKCDVETIVQVETSWQLYCFTDELPLCFGDKTESGYIQKCVRIIPTHSMKLHSAAGEWSSAYTQNIQRGFYGQTVECSIINHLTSVEQAMCFLAKVLPKYLDQLKVSKFSKAYPHIHTFFFVF